MFIWHNQATEKPEVIYEFPWSEATIHEISLYGKFMYSRQPMQKPVLLINDIYLTRIKDKWYEVPSHILHSQHNQ
jgi:hypothetical protein